MQHLVELASMVNADAEKGFHLSYGDCRHEYFIHSSKMNHEFSSSPESFLNQSRQIAGRRRGRAKTLTFQGLAQQRHTLHE